MQDSLAYLDTPIESVIDYSEGKRQSWKRSLRSSTYSTLGDASNEPDASSSDFNRSSTKYVKVL